MKRFFCMTAPDMALSAVRAAIPDEGVRIVVASPDSPTFMWDQNNT